MSVFSIVLLKVGEHVRVVMYRDAQVSTSPLELHHRSCVDHHILLVCALDHAAVAAAAAATETCDARDMKRRKAKLKARTFVCAFALTESESSYYVRHGLDHQHGIQAERSAQKLRKKVHTCAG